MITRGGLHRVVIEDDGRIIRAVAVPYGDEALVIGPGARGQRIAHRERFDAESITGVGAMYGRPILMSHDQTRPTGILLSTRSTARGLEIEGELLGSDPELDSIRKRAAGGILSHMSVGYVPNKRLDRWERPDDTGLPLVVRRGAEVREISLVLWPAFDGAKILGIYQRTAAAVARKESSDRAIAEAEAVMARMRR